MMWITHWAKVAVPGLLLGMGAYAISQESPATPSGFPRSSEVKTEQAEEDPAATIRRIEKEWGEAILERDAETVAPFLADDFIGTDRHGNVFDKVTYLADLKKGFGAVKVEFPEMKVRIYGDTGVVTGVVRYAKESTTIGAGRIGVTNPDGNAISADGFTLRKEASDRYTSTYIKQRGRWRCVVYQASSYLDINGLEVNPNEYYEAPIRRAR